MGAETSHQNFFCGSKLLKQGGKYFSPTGVSTSTPCKEFIRTLIRTNEIKLAILLEHIKPLDIILASFNTLSNSSSKSATPGLKGIG